MENTKQEPSTFEIQDLITNAWIFDTTSDVMTGALYGKTGPMTKEDAQKTLNEFLKKPVKGE